MRKGEENVKAGSFMTSTELDQMEREGKIAYRFKVFGGEYAYLAEEVFSQNDYIMEMHYTTIDDWKKIRPDLKTIYILPRDINVAIQKTKERNLSQDKEMERIEEIKEQYNRFLNDENLRKKFDFCIYNDYNINSKNQIIDIINNLK